MSTFYMRRRACLVSSTKWQINAGKLGVRLSVHFSDIIFPSICPSVCLVHLFLCLSVHLSVGLSVCLPVCLFVCLSPRLYRYLYEIFDVNEQHFGLHWDEDVGTDQDLSIIIYRLDVFTSTLSVFQLMDQVRPQACSTINVLGQRDI